jgi:outer membrane receptor for ferrienterochelin and colicins
MGYKSPGYRQLYQVFTNVAQGYSVIGANIFTEGVTKLKEAGLVQQVWPLANTISNLQAETSTSYNVGFTVQPVRQLEWNANVFYNDIRNLINTQQVGVKTNGSQLFSYVNIAKAFTNGIETGITIHPIKGLSISGSYQLLYAKDRAVIDSIATRSPRYDTVRSFPSLRASTSKDYFGLPNRSRHMANVQVFYEIKPLGANCSIRANYRGKYGFLDTDNNGFIDPYDVYVKGYMLLNASVQKKLWKERLTLQLTIDNITNHTDYLMPAQPGRIILAGASWRFFDRNRNSNSK